ncbi:Translation elongation factor EF1B, beta chain, archaeal [mine drainage metagenome]|uniref:Elongation factor 1-beta n=1 Tax=mine drainage metagenome TaxID=410659 RepID=T1CC88_9ZZZZ
MGTVSVLYRVMPQDVRVDMRALAEGAKAALPPQVKLRGLQVRDVAYGLKELLVAVQMDDAGGILEQVERALAAVPHAESVEVLESSLL